MADEIDPTANLANSSIYIFSGNQDIVTPPWQQKVQQLIYEHYGTGHVHLIEYEGNHYFGKEHMLTALKQIYVDLGYVDDVHSFNEPAEELEDGAWIDFDQTEFVGVGFDIAFDDTNWWETGQVYIPSTCYTSTCRVHVAFHGCTSNGS